MYVCLYCEGGEITDDIKHGCAISVAGGIMCLGRPSVRTFGTNVDFDPRDELIRFCDQRSKVKFTVTIEQIFSHRLTPEFRR